MHKGLPSSVDLSQDSSRSYLQHDCGSKCLSKGKSGKILALVVISILLFPPALCITAGDEITSTKAPADYQPEIINEPIIMGSDKLIIQDVWPWTSHGIETVLKERGESYDIIPTAYLATWNLSKYRVVIISSTQWSWSYDNLIAQKDKLASYVAAGGVLVVHGADMGWDGTGYWRSSFLPGGVYHACYAYGGHLTQNPHIVDPTHPIVKGLTDDILANWYYSAHGYFTNLPENARIIIVDHAGYPIYIEYKYGAGTVLATMMTIEWPFVAYWWGLGEPQQRLLRNEIEYAQMLATHVDLWISNIVPVQVVYDVDINNDGKMDLVQGKKTAVFVYVEGFENLSNETNICVNLEFEGRTYSECQPVSSLRRDKRVKFFLTPQSTGDQLILARVDPFNQISEINEGNNDRNMTVTVKETTGLRILFVRVANNPYYTWPKWYDYGAPSLENFMETAERSAEFIRATYPVAESKFEAFIESIRTFYGTPLPIAEKEKWSKALFDDIAYLAYYKRVWPYFDRMVGIVSDEYFYAHIGIKQLGWAPPNTGVVLVTEGYWTLAAHEIGHTYGLEDEYNYEVGKQIEGGYWVEKQRDIIDGVCFMGSFHKPREFSPNWICNKCFENLFKRFRIGPDPGDSIIVVGFIYKNLTLKLKEFYLVKNVSIEYPISGNYSLVILDWNNKIIDTLSFHAPFYMLMDPLGIVETNITVFAFLAPYPLNTSKWIIKYGNTTLIKLNPNTKLLHDAVDSIPDRGFVDNPDQRRKALHNKIDAVEKMLEHKDFKGAVEKLKNDIKDKIVKWLKDYSVDDPLKQLRKDEVLELIDGIIYRLSSQIGAERQFSS